MAVHITTGYPLIYGDQKTQLANVQGVVTDLIDQLQHALYNLDAGNVKEAASVKAEHIDTTNAKIMNAQIKSMTADKLTAGTIDADKINVVNLKAGNITSGTLDTGKVTIKSGDDSLILDDGTITFSDVWGNRLIMGQDDNGQFAFSMYDRDGNPTLYMDEHGDAIFKGKVQGGSIESDTSINVSTDVNVGNNLNLKIGTYGPEGYAQGAIQFKSGATTVSQIIAYPDGTFTITGSTSFLGPINAPNVKIGLEDVATKAWVEEHFSKK